MMPWWMQVLVGIGVLAFIGLMLMLGLSLDMQSKEKGPFGICLDPRHEREKGSFGICLTCNKKEQP